MWDYTATQYIFNYINFIKFIENNISLVFYYMYFYIYHTYKKFIHIYKIYREECVFVCFFFIFCILIINIIIYSIFLLVNKLTNNQQTRIKKTWENGNFVYNFFMEKFCCCCFSLYTYKQIKYNNTIGFFFLLQFFNKIISKQQNIMSL